MNRRIVVDRSIALLVCGSFLVSGCGVDSSKGSLPPPRVRVVETAPLRIDGIYKSMQGPFAWAEVDVSDLDWVTAYRTEVIDAQTDEKLGDEFFCHSSIQQLNTTRLFMTATGIEDIELPEGFGMPFSQILSGLPADQRKLKMLGMVLNNHVDVINRLAKVRVTLEYYTDADVGSPPKLKKLYPQGLTLEVKDLAEYEPEEGMTISDDVATHCALVGGFIGHWIVPPGPQKTRKRYSRFLPVDGTVHHAVAHLHNYGVYMRLTDVTTGELLFQADARYERDRMQLAEISAYSSREGFRMYRDHEYEIEAFYDNTSDRDVDAMAMMSLYYRPENDVDIFYPNPPGES